MKKESVYYSLSKVPQLERGPGQSIYSPLARARPLCFNRASCARRLRRLRRAYRGVLALRCCTRVRPRGRRRRAGRGWSRRGGQSRCKRSDVSAVSETNIQGDESATSALEGAKVDFKSRLSRTPLTSSSRLFRTPDQPTASSCPSPRPSSFHTCRPNTHPPPASHSSSSSP